MLKRIAVVAVLIAASIPTSASAAEWPTWGNGRISDCSFAAAANWELAALGHRASEVQVEREYVEAGGGEEGISAAKFSGWWRQHGIGGIRAELREVRGQNLWEANPHSRHRLGLLLRRAHYLLATLVWEFGHEVLIVGVSPRGVRFVTWGEERTLSWRDWYEAVAGTYVVTVVR